MVASLDRREEIYAEYFEKVTGYIRSHIKNDQDREDITSEVFLKVYAKLDSYDERKASLSTWIYIITKNTVIDYYKNKKSYEELTESIAAEDKVNMDNALDDLADALGQLGERERDLIVLYYYSGYTLKSVADMMNISYIYAKVIHKNALNELRTLMNGGQNCGK